VGQTGDLRPIYYQFKRNALFARSFEQILANATDASAQYKNFTSDTALRIYARHSNNGDIVFIDNPGKTDRNIPGLTAKLARLFVGRCKLLTGIAGYQARLPACRQHHV